MEKGKVVEILRKEYGIKSLKELNEAIAKLQPIDLTPFVGLVIK